MHTSTLQRQMTAPTLVVEEPIDVDSFLEMQLLPEFRDQEYELIHGEMIEMPAPAWGHGQYAGDIYSHLRDYARQTGLGSASTEAGVRSVFDPYTLLRPDAAFVLFTTLPNPPSDRILAAFPDVAVEVKSRTESVLAMREKADLYLRNGTQLVWLVFPLDKRIEVHAADGSTTTLGIDDSLTGGDVLPGFTLPIREIFDPYGAGG